MTYHSDFKIEGEFTLEIGNQKYTFKNMIMDSGKEMIIGSLLGDSTEFLQFIRVGTGSVDEDASQTFLQGISLGTREFDSVVQGPRSIVFLSTFGYNEANTSSNFINEVGVFTNNNNMFCRKVVDNVDTITKSITQLLKVTYKVSVI